MSFKSARKNNNVGYVGSAAFIIGVVLVLTAFFGLQEARYWKKHGTPVQGDVLDKYVKEECQSGGSTSTRSCINRYYIDYRYSTTQGVTFKGKDSIHKQVWEAQKRDSKINLLYSSVEPNKSSLSYALGGNTQKLLWTIISFVGGALILIGVFLLVTLLAKSKGIHK